MNLTRIFIFFFYTIIYELILFQLAQTQFESNVGKIKKKKKEEINLIKLESEYIHLQNN